MHGISGFEMLFQFNQLPSSIELFALTGLSRYMEGEVEMRGEKEHARGKGWEPFIRGTVMKMEEISQR